ncbi:glycosyl hydrolase [Acidobacteria bacterium Mor1]|nr:glycosyl hydrolase [Acidobacteria bacterium Mor1]
MLLFAALLIASPAAAKRGKKSESDEGPKSKMSAETFKGLEMRGLGPALMSGRIADIAIHPDKQNTWYIGVGSGGVWKTENAGTTWKSIFDGQKSYSIGCITIDPRHPDVIWVGTGENVGGRHVGYGDGIYRSRDGGAHWEHLGLENSEHIGNIIVHPENSEVVYAAVQGPLWSPGGDRGLYKTVDGGKNWEKILGGGDYTGVNEVRMDPRDPEVLYATTHQRYRNVAALINGGPETAIHKSTDGGKSWRELTHGLPKEDMGKIGLAISPMKPDVIYATIEVGHRKGGFFRSTDGGEHWEKRNDYISGGTGPHYYMEIFASPHHFDHVYQMDVWMHFTDDGGKSFNRVGEQAKHSDNHALAFNPKDPDYLLAGCDGGLYQSWDRGKTWTFVANLPVTQFYKVAVDYDEPFYNVYGGTQDNNTQGGPSRTDNITGIRNSDWFITLFGDGHQPAVDPTNPDIVYSEWQEGNLTRYDRRTGEIVYIQPQPREGEPSERFNWDAPILISPHDPARLYFASQRVWRSDDRGDSWRPVSGDLSHGKDRLTEPMMGRVQSFDAVWDLWAMSKYATITSLSESPQVEGLLYAGTDDGRVQVSENGGQSWRAIDSLPGVPDGFFVNDIKADLHDADTVYVVADDHKNGDFSPYVLKSTDRGKRWTSLRGDLPDRHLAWRLVQDHVNPRLLFVGTEFGVFFSVNGGSNWIKLTGGTPNIPFRDLAIQKRENDLVGATFGRGFWVLDDYTPLRTIDEALLEKDAALFPVRDTFWYVEKRPLGNRPKASQGDAFYSAPNPPFGAVFTVYLKDDILTKRKARQKTEKKQIEDGADTPYPGWDEVHEENVEEDPALLFTVTNSAGEVVRRLSAPAKAGFQRIAWDLRYPMTRPWTENPTRNPWQSPYQAMAMPGTYKVSLAKRVAGEITDLGMSETFEVKPLRDPALPGSPARDAVSFLRRVAELQRKAQGTGSTLREARRKVRAIRESLMNSTVSGTELDHEVRRIERALIDLGRTLSGDRERDNFGDPGPVSISSRISVASMGTQYSLYGPTPTHRESAGIAERELTKLGTSLKQLLETDLPALERRLEAAGVPWTPGRLFP